MLASIRRRTSAHHRLTSLNLSNRTLGARILPRRFASTSTYNVHIAGLDEEQTEFREAVAEFAQREVAPRAAEIDKTNNSPMVCSVHKRGTILGLLS